MASTATDDTVLVLFLRSGLTIQEQVHIAGTWMPLPKAVFQTEEEQIADMGAVYYRPLTKDDVAAGVIPASESYLAPRAEHAQVTAELLTVKETAALLRCNPKYVLTLIKRGVVGAAKLDPSAPNSPWRIRRSSLVRFLDNDRLGDEELEELGRPPRALGSSVSLSAPGGVMTGTAYEVTENQALAALTDEVEADEPSIPHPLSKD